ncbi:MAG: SPOR domain-containing protein [Aliidongia sp.]
MCLGLVALILCKAAAADPAADIETLEAAASSHVAAYGALDAQRSKLELQYRSLIEELTKRLSFGTAAKNPVLLKSWQQAQDTLAELGKTAEPLSAAAGDLTDDAAKANALGREIHAALAAPGADPAVLQPLAERITAASDRLDHSLAEALEQRRKQAATIKADEQELDRLAQAIDTGHLPDTGTADSTMADMLAPPRLMDPSAQPGPAAPRAAAESGRWAVEFGLFPTVDDAGYIMAMLSQRGTASHFVQVSDRRGHPAFKVLTRGFASRSAAEAAATELKRHDLHPNGVVETTP